MSHFVKICEYGGVHGQCRCPSPNKEIRRVDCNMPNSHSKRPGPMTTTYLTKRAENE